MKKYHIHCKRCGHEVKEAFGLAAGKDLVALMTLEEFHGRKVRNVEVDRYGTAHIYFDPPIYDPCICTGQRAAAQAVSAKLAKRPIT